MASKFEEHFKIKFNNAQIIGSFDAILKLKLSKQELFNKFVDDKDFLKFYGQTIKKIDDYFIVNYDLPAVLNKYDFTANVFVVLINSNNKLLVEGSPLNVSQLRDKAKEFIANPSDLDNLPAKKDVEVDFFGSYEVSKQVISLQNDRGTSYKMYIKVQNELAAAYNELRDELSLQKFGKPYSELSKDKRKAVKRICPQRISEAEPKNVGGAE